MIQSPSNREQICRSVGARRAAPASVHFPVVGSKLDPRTGDLLSSSGAAPLALRHSLSLHDDSVLALALCSERRLLFVGTQDGEIHAWDTSLFLRVKVLKAHQRAVTDLASLGVEGLLVSAARDGRVRIWNFSSWECVGTIEGLESPVLNIKVIEGILYAGTVSTRILVIDIHSVLAKSEENPGQGISYVDGHRGYIFTVEKSQNPKVLYTGSGGNCFLLMFNLS